MYFLILLFLLYLQVIFRYIEALVCMECPLCLRAKDQPHVKE